MSHPGLRLARTPGISRGKAGWHTVNAVLEYELEFDKVCSARGCQVAASERDVIPLHARSAASPRSKTSSPAITLSRLRAAAEQLDELRRCAERVALDPQWSAMEWRATCASLLIQLSEARHLLASLSPIRVGQWPDTEWAARVRTSRSDVERRLLDVRVAMSALTSNGASDPTRWSL